MKILIFCLIFILTACTATNKKNSYYNFIKGLNAYEKGEKIIALKNYKLAYEKGLKETYLLTEMAYLYAEFGDYNKAKNLYIEILAREPENEKAIHNLLEILYVEEDIKNIDKYCKNILNKNSNLYIESQFNLAYFKQDYKLARKILELNKKNIFKKDYDEKIFLKIKEIYSEEDKEDLVKILDIANSFYENNMSFIKYYSSELIEIKDYKKAEKILMKEVMKNDNYNGVLVDLAEVYYLDNKKQKFMDTMKILEDKVLKDTCQKEELIKNKKYIKLKNKMK